MVTHGFGPVSEGIRNRFGNPLESFPVDRLRTGALVAQVACGHGKATLEMARAFRSSTFIGFDEREGSLEIARRAAGLPRSRLTASTSLHRVWEARP